MNLARPPRETPTRDALLDAAHGAIVAGRWPHVRMVDVASEAGVSRQTLYNEFGTKDALCQALALREAGRFLAGTQSAMQRHGGSASEAIGAGVCWGLQVAADDPLVKAVLTDDAAGLLPFVTTRAQPVLEAVRDGIAAFLEERWPASAVTSHAAPTPVTAATDVADVVVRLTISYLLLPTEPIGASAARVAHVVDRLVHSRQTG